MINLSKLPIEHTHKFCRTCGTTVISYGSLPHIIQYMNVVEYQKHLSISIYTIYKKTDGLLSGYNFIYFI